MSSRLFVLGVIIICFLAWALTEARGSSLSQASYYGPGLYGNHTFCGQILRTRTFGVAHRSLPCGTRLLICRGRRCVTAYVIDRGPFNYSRDLDLTAATATSLCGCASRTWGVRLVAWKVM